MVQKRYTNKEIITASILPKIEPKIEYQSKMIHDMNKEKIQKDYTD